MTPQPIKVLMIEDNPGDLSLIQKMLAAARDTQFHVETADCLSKGLGLLDEVEIDIVLLDLHLPDSHGLDTLYRVHHLASSIPVVILSGSDDATMAVEAVHVGAQDYLIKGQIDNPMLVRALRYAVERARLLTREQRARADAEDAQRRFAFLAEVSDQLATSLDYDATLHLIADLAVPRFADCCVVHTVNDNQTVGQPVVVHVDPLHEELIHELFRSYPITLDDPQSILARVLRTGQPILTGEIPDSLIESIAKDDRYLELLRAVRPVSGIAVPLIARGKPLGSMAFTHSVSGRRYEPGDLALALEVAHRAALAVDNARLYGELRRADQRKDEFLAMLAHELRTPLGTIVNAVQVMRHLGMPNRSLQQARDVVERQARQIARLVDDLLDVARIARGKLELRKETVDLATVVACAVQTSRPLIEARRHEMSVSLPPQPVWLEADSGRLEQIISNLLNNAAKYTEPGGHIWITAEQDENEAVIRVRDTGVGIAPDMLPRIFDLFMQVDPSVYRAQGGLGLGLTLVRNLVHMQGGSISAHSDGPGRGSEFTVKLPALSRSRPVGVSDAGNQRRSVRPEPTRHPSG